MISQVMYDPFVPGRFTVPSGARRRSTPPATAASLATSGVQQNRLAFAGSSFSLVRAAVAAGEATHSLRITSPAMATSSRDESL